MTDGPAAEAEHRYLHIADVLRTAIEDGEYRTGDRLPGEQALASQFSVSPMTARHAIRVLKAEGLAESRKGAGVFVQAFRRIRSRRIPRLARDQWGSGKSIWEADDDRSLAVDQVTVLEAPPPQDIATVLGLAEGESACIRSRRYSLDGRPVLLATSYLPLNLVAGSAITRADTGPGGIYARLAELGHAPARYREEIRGAGVPTPGEAARLSIAADRQILRLCRTAFDAERAVVEVNEMTMDAASYVLEYEYDA